MNTMIEADALELLSGPEDGTRYPLVGGPADIGSSADCEIHVRLDASIRGHNARLAGTDDGYSVRVLEGGKIYINGKRVGAVRARELLNGDILQVGESEFCLHCSAEGQGDRGKGQILESDAAYMLRFAGRHTGHILLVAASFARSVAGPFLKPLLILAVIIFLPLLAYSAVGRWMFHEAVWLFGWARYYFWTFLSYIR